MRWSKLRKRVKDGFAASLEDRVDINSAAYGNCPCGHAWITLDGDVVANFCSRAAGNLYMQPDITPTNNMYKHQLLDYGEMSRQDAYRACWAFLHDLSIEEAIEDEDPLVQTLAVLDRRLGKRRLGVIETESLHPLARKMLDIRLQAEAR